MDRRANVGQNPHRCAWLRLLTGTSCLLGACTRRDRTLGLQPPVAPDDLLHQARQWHRDLGKAAGRARFERALARQSDSHGNFETHILRTSRDAAFADPDALACLGSR